MKKFRFRLEPLLKLRKHRERECQKEHAEAMQNVAQQQDQLCGIDSERERTLTLQRERLAGTLSTTSLLACSRYLLRLKADTMTGREVLRGLEQKAEMKRGKLVEAARERKMYEKLRERQQEKYYQDVKRREVVDNDEIALNSFRSSKTR